MPSSSVTLTYVLIQACVSLRNGLPPDDLACRESHDDVNVISALCYEIHIVTEAVSLGEKNLGEVVLLLGY